MKAMTTDWQAQAEADAKEDRTQLVFDGQEPDQLACDTTLRPMADGSWLVVGLRSTPDNSALFSSAGLAAYNPMGSLQVVAACGSATFEGYGSSSPCITRT